ncbi:MAG: hydroxylamine reductase, partial [Kiritimatiellota bacterium]|nr:hydroxylamine reductase [Kiritimatiellota bacterium]
MFCYQCEQMAKEAGCTLSGVCGKDAQTAALQDLLVYQAKQVARQAQLARSLEIMDNEADRFILEALFSTVTNVNFDPVRLQALLAASELHLKRVQERYEEVCRKQGQPPEKPPVSAIGLLERDVAGLVRQGEAVGILTRRSQLGDDRAGLQELLTSGLKGMAAYAYHARVLGKEDAGVYEFLGAALDFLTRPDPSVNDLLAMCLKCGEVNLKVMGLLDAANTEAYDHPVPTAVRIHPRKGKAILVSGHDLKDLEMLLKQTEGKGINIYTHGEMLPAHGYPGLKKYRHLVGNYGGAWQ